MVIILAGSGGRVYAGSGDKVRDDHRDNGHWRDKHRDQDDDDARRGYGFGDHDLDEIRSSYASNYRHLPPGLAKKDRLAVGLERQLVVHGTFPPGLLREVYPVPVDLDRHLPPAFRL